MARKNTDYTNIPKEKFEFFDRSEAIHDKKLETKPVGYFKDAMMRFCRNKSSLTAAVIICTYCSACVTQQLYKIED